MAKRRNTALASIAGSGPLGDISCLFGRNGREHMKWTDKRGRRGEAQARVDVEYQGEFVGIEGWFLLRGADWFFDRHAAFGSTG